MANSVTRGCSRSQIQSYVRARGVQILCSKLLHYNTDSEYLSKNFNDKKNNRYIGQIYRHFILIIDIPTCACPSSVGQQQNEKMFYQSIISKIKEHVLIQCMRFK